LGDAVTSNNNNDNSTNTGPEVSKPPKQGKRSNGKRKVQPFDHSVVKEEDEEDTVVQSPYQRATTLELRTGSPRKSEGPSFELPEGAISEEAERAARGESQVNGFGKGFSNYGLQCYRNAIVVALMHSQRIMAWLENEYVPNLVVAGLAIIPFEGTEQRVPSGNTRAGAAVWEGDQSYERVPLKTTTGEQAVTLSEIKYTDALCELYELSRVYWADPSQQKLNKAMARFWGYLHQPSLQFEASCTFSFDGQQDANEFLQWLLDLAQRQLQHFCNGPEITEWVTL
jgi:hypothetical protein